MSNPFDVMQVDARFDLDEAELHRRFIAASSAHHPDRFTDPFEQAEAAARLAAVNEAYRTLRDPEGRANALLEALGGPAKEDDKSLPPDLLMDMMEIREALESAVQEQDAAELARLRDLAQRERASRLQTITNLFAKASKADGEPRETLLKQARMELNALRYFQRMIEQMPDE